MRRATRWMALAGGVSLAAVAAHGGAEHALRAQVQAALGSAASQATVFVDPWSGRIALRDLAWTGAGGARVTIGAVRLNAGSALLATAQAADAVSLDNVVIESGATRYTLKRVDVTGTSMSREDVAALLDKSSSTPMAERLARLSASQIAIPELVVSQKSANASVEATYRDIRLVDVDKGRVKSFAASGGVFETHADKDGVKGTVGPVSGSDVDTVLVARIYTDKAGPGDTEPKTAYGAFTIDTITGTADKGGGFAIDHVVVKNFKARPTSEPMLPFFEEFAGKQDVAKMPGPERARFVNGLVDILEAFSVDLVEASGITLTAPPSDKEKAAVKVARMSYAGAGMGKPNDMRLEGLDVTAPNGYGRIGSISQTGWSFKATLDALRATLGDPGNDLSDLDPRMFIPDLGTFAIRDIDLNVPDDKAKAKDPSAPNIRVGLKTFDVSTGSPVKGVPTALRVGMDRLTMAIPPGSKEEGLKDLLSMGYKDVDFSFGLDGRWNENAAEFTIGQIALQGVNMGNLTVKGLLGNVTKDVFAGDSATAQVALLGATVKQLGFTLENKGLAEKLLERMAREQKKSPDQLRKELGGAAQVGIPAMLGGSANAKALGAAVAKFIVKPGRLSVTASARDPGGLGMADFAMAQGDPASLLEQVNITATAE